MSEYLIRQAGEVRDVVIIRGAVSPDHLRMLLPASPHLAPAKLVLNRRGFVPVLFCSRVNAPWERCGTGTG